MAGYTKIALTGIMLLAIFFRFYDLKNTPPGLYADEAMNGNNILEARAMNSPAGGLKVFYKDNNGREGLFINLQALSVAAFGNKPWALRLPSAIFGTLTVLGLFYLSRILFWESRYRDHIALAAAFFMASSFWHILFSRIGFRAITAPFFLVWGLFFLIKIYKNIGSRLSQIFSAIIGGLLFGLGFHSYLSYRVSPALALLPIIAGLIKHWRDEGELRKFIILNFIFIIFALAAFLPLGLYFMENPGDFLGRTSQVSIFATDSPLQSLSENIVKTTGMFWVAGDFNWRHNYSGSPQLFWPVGIFFLIGLIHIFYLIFKKGAKSESRFNAWFLLFWLLLMLLPVIISSEGLPHALRSIIVIPAAMIISAWGLKTAMARLFKWLSGQKERYDEYAHQIRRIGKEIKILLAALLIFIAWNSYDLYFNNWALNPQVYSAFDERKSDIANYLNKFANDTEKIVAITSERIDSRIVTISSQPILFETDTFLIEKRREKNFYYLAPDEVKQKLRSEFPEKAVIVFLNDDPEDQKLMGDLLKEFNKFKVSFGGTFIALVAAP
ncbi:glycosyltransferase family 39 protein [Candidatus Giovannonibacteria bacterium]|nr:glycosyltransferase family 39 protein [Candidatus Giovannonibacteria bacterium]